MKNIFTVILFLMIGVPTFAQQQTFDLISFTPPKGWTKKVDGTTLSYTKVDNKKKTYCQIFIIKSTDSKGTIEADFENEWQEIVVKSYKPTDKPQVNKVAEAEGWNIKSGGATFTFNNSNSKAMLITASGYNRCASIVTITNSEDYTKSIETFIASVDLIKPEIAKPLAEQPEILQQSNNTNNESASIIGKWLKTSTSNSNYEVSNGLHQYHKMQYEFKPNGTYNFLYRSFSYMPDIYIAKENGTYIIQGNSITVIPQVSVFETWSKGTIIDANGKNATLDKLGKLKSSQKRALEKITYQFTINYYSDINESSLLLQYNKETERDGPFNGGSAFSNTWFYGNAKFPIELK